MHPLIKITNLKQAPLAERLRFYLSNLKKNNSGSFYLVRGTFFFGKFISACPPHKSKHETGNNYNTIRNSRNVEDANYPVQPTHRESLSNKGSETFERLHTLLLIQNRREGIHIIKHLLMDNDFMIMNLV